MYKVVCASCGKKYETNMKFPKSVPTYCRDCSAKRMKMIPCSQCGALLPIPGKSAGLPYTCLECGNTFEVPSIL